MICAGRSVFSIRFAALAAPLTSTIVVPLQSSSFGADNTGFALRHGRADSPCKSNGEMSGDRSRRQSTVLNMADDWIAIIDCDTPNCDRGPPEVVSRGHHRLSSSIIHRISMVRSLLLLLLLSSARGLMLSNLFGPPRTRARALVQAKRAITDYRKNLLEAAKTARPETSFVLSLFGPPRNRARAYVYAKRAICTRFDDEVNSRAASLKDVEVCEIYERSNATTCHSRAATNAHTFWRAQSVLPLRISINDEELVE